MNLRHLRTAALTAAALTALAACSSESPTDADKPAGPSPAEQVSKQAHAYMSAWMAIEPADGKTMCALQTKAARPNFKKDGGTLDGCIKQRAKNSAGETADPGKPKLTIAISKFQDVPASDTHPAGTKSATYCDS
jgi:hypothetical protein